jgi:hypothetical protein
MNHLFKALIALSIIISMTACDDELDAFKGKEASMLIFENQDDFHQAVSRSVEMPVADLEEWTKSQGINSFGVEALKRYNSINFEELSSRDELLSIIDNNRDYLVLEEIGHELYLETKYHDQANRFLINHDRLVQIGDKVHKIFKQGEVKASLDKIESVRAITEEQFDQLVSIENQRTTNGLEIVRIESKRMPFVPIDCDGTGGGTGGGTGDDPYNHCGDYHEDASSNDRDRTKATAKISKKFSGGTYIYKVDLLVRPYKRTLGIWYWCTRTITGEATFEPRKENGLPIVDQPVTYGRDTEYDSKWERSWASPNANYDSNPHFYSIYMYGDTPSTPPVTISCN